MENIGNPGLGAGFAAIVLVTLLAFAGGLWWYLDDSMGREIANTTVVEFVTGYLIERALAADNLFVWLVLFSFFAVPAELQKHVLLYGVLGAIVMRNVLIFAVD
ncbi:MAG: hypothetical protein WBJ68_07080 [Candidatus Dechloromonas phosphoritropha]|jgi:tellurite resistance protein TerC